VQIELLADRPEFIPQLAEWHHYAFGYLRPDFSVADRVAMLKERCGRREPPITFVASAGDELLGSAMLVARDMDTHPHFFPWLAGVFVSPAHRRRGVGRALSEHVTREARLLGFSTLYLYTPSAEGFYARFDWSAVERAHYRGTDVTIMSHTQVV
jgi:predicted N-acetyltransferase YhbS